MPNLSSVIQLYKKVVSNSPFTSYTNMTLGSLSVLKVACAPQTMSPVKLVINEDTFTIPPAHLITTQGADCIFTFAALSNGAPPPFDTSYTLGYSFLYPYYAFFDYDENTLTLGAPV